MVGRGGRAASPRGGRAGRAAVEGHRGADSGSQPRAVLAAMEESAEARAEEGALDRRGGQSAAILQAEVRQLGGSGGEHRGPHGEAVPRALVQPRGSFDSEKVGLGASCDRSNWTAKEDNLILSLQQQWGNRWSSIADVRRLLPLFSLATPRTLRERRQDSMEVASTPRHGRGGALPGLLAYRPHAPSRPDPRGLRLLRAKHGNGELRRLQSEGRSCQYC